MLAHDNFASFVRSLLYLANPALAVLVALALAIFFWGIANYIFSAGGSSEAKNGREVMVWGIIALVVLICIWSIVAVIRNTFLGNYY